MNRRNGLSTAGFLVASTLLLAGCSTSNEASSGAANGTAETMNAMFVGGTADRDLIEVVKQVTEEFNASNEFGVNIEIETYENEQYKTKLASLMASNSQPDVFFTWSSGYLAPFARGGKVLDLSPYLDADKEWKKRFNDGVFGPVTIDDKVYAIPNGQALAVMYYNSDIFEAQGLSIPNTYDEFLQTVKKLKSAGITPISVPSKDAWIAGEMLQQLGNSVGGIDLFNETVSGATPWNSREYIEAGKMLQDLAEIGAFPSGYLGMSNDEGRDLFTSGQTAMYYMGSWDVSVLSDEDLEVAGRIGAFNIPAVDPSAGQNVAVGDVDLAYAVSSKAKDADAAVAYIKMFSEPSAQEQFAYNASYLIATDTPLDETKLSPLFVEVNSLLQEITGLTPWFDRVFGAGEGVEFNNVAQAVIAGDDPGPRFDELQRFAEANADR